jgi:hypothetical protein
MSGDVCVVSWLTEDTLAFSYAGAVTERALAAAYVEYGALHRVRKERYQFVDVLAVTSLEPGGVETIGKILADFRAGGGKHVVMVATPGFAKMMGSSMSFGAGTSLVFAESHEAGVVELSRLRRASQRP